MIIFKSNECKRIEKQLNEIKVNLENNYKDLAIKACKESEVLMEDGYRAGKLKQKEYVDLKRKLNDFKQKMHHYDHTNVSKFLKERY
ncbi:MAG: hypothetical protein ACLRZ7_03865 [Lachnospiraceae bacterium]